MPRKSQSLQIHLTAISEILGVEITPIDLILLVAKKHGAIQPVTSAAAAAAQAAEAAPHVKPRVNLDDVDPAGVTFGERSDGLVISENGAARRVQK